MTSPANYNTFLHIHRYFKKLLTFIFYIKRNITNKILSQISGRTSRNLQAPAPTNNIREKEITSFFLNQWERQEYQTAILYPGPKEIQISNFGRCLSQWYGGPGPSGWCRGSGQLPPRNTRVYRQGTGRWDKWCVD